MRKLYKLLVVLFLIITGCKTQNYNGSNNGSLSGTFIKQNSTKKLELKQNGTYTLYNAAINFSPVINQCEIASKGKWSKLSNRVIDVISENYYLEQEGFQYRIKKENKFSQDSLYINVIFPTDFHPVKLNFTFNYNNAKSISTDENYIAIPKSKYLWSRRTATNQIGFNLNSNVSGTVLYNSRILFEVFQEVIDTEEYNYLTISLPNFDRCFFEFEPLYHDLIFFRDKNTIRWRGELWKKIVNM